MKQRNNRRRMRQRYAYALLSAGLLAGTLGQAGVTFAAGVPATVGQIHVPAPDGGAAGDSPLAGDQFLFQQRSAVGGYISPAAYAEALHQAASLKQQSAQAISTGQLAAGQAPYGTWSNLGPQPIQGEYFGSTDSGRVTTMGIGSGGTLYAGSAGGGVWKSTDNGNHWTALTDGTLADGVTPIPSLAIGALTVIPGNSPATDTIYAGTGEDVPAIDAQYGQGILKSTDGGATWTQLGASTFAGQQIRQIVVDPNGTMYVASTVGLYESTDGGQTFTGPAINSEITNISAIVQDPSDASGNTLFAVVPITGVKNPTADVALVGLWETTNGGSTWTHILSGLPTGTSFDNTAMAISPSNPNVMYMGISTVAKGKAYGALSGLYISTDAGADWTMVQNVPDYLSQPYFYGSGTGAQGWYDNAIAVNPTNPYDVTVGGIAAADIQVSPATGGGYTSVNTNLATKYNIHPDQHALVYDAAGDLYIGNDGGVWEIPVGQKARDLNSNLVLTQFYQGISQYGSGQMIMGGSQDNGTVIGDVYKGDPWTELGGGDGFVTAINPMNPNLVYGSYEQGQIYEVDLANGNSFFTYPQNTKGAQWVAPYVLDPQNPSVIYAGYEDVYMSTDGGQTWSGPLTNMYQTTQNANYDVSAIAVSPSNPNVVYAAWSGEGYNSAGSLVAQSNIEMSTNGGATWTDITPSGFSNNWVTGLTVSASNPYQLYTTLSGYYPIGYPKGAPHVLLNTATNAGGTWTDITGNLPNAPVNALAIDGPYTLVASDMGVYSTVDGKNWYAVGQGLPNAAVMDLKVMENGSLLVATHGRGLFTVSPLHLTEILSMTQNYSHTTGGDTITITGSGFSGATGVQINGVTVPSADVTILNNNVLQLTTPAQSVIDAAHAGSPRTYDIQVQGQYGLSPITPTDELTYGAQLGMSVNPQYYGSVYAGYPLQVQGVLGDVYSGNPIAGQSATIQLFSAGSSVAVSSASVTTDVYGGFVANLSTPTLAGPYTVTASVYGGNVYTMSNIQVLPGLPASIMWDTPETTTLSENGYTFLSGQVYDAFGNPATDTSVMLTTSNSDGYVQPTVVTDATGTFTTPFLAGTTPGLVSVTASVYGTPAVSTPQVLHISGLDVNHVPTQIILLPTYGQVGEGTGDVINGTALDANGNPVANQVVTITIPTEAVQMSVTTNAKGQFSFTVTAPNVPGALYINAAMEGANPVVGYTVINVYAPAVFSGGGSTSGSGSTGGTPATGGSSDLSTTVTTASFGATGGSTTQTYGSSTITIAAPAGAFASNEQVSVTTADVSTIQNLLTGLPSQDSAALAFGVSYSGAAPTQPITLTIKNPSIYPGMTIYKVSSSGAPVPVKTAVVTQGQAIVTFTSDPDFVVVKPPVPALPTLTSDERALQWGLKLSVVPGLVQSDPNTKVKTTYMPIWYVMQMLNDYGFTSTWDGKTKTWNLTTTATVKLGSVIGEGPTTIQVNGSLAAQAPSLAQKDPLTGVLTTYMPIWYVMQVLKELGFTSTWNGKEWTLTPTTTSPSA